MKKYIIVALLCLLIPMTLRAGISINPHQGMKQVVQYQVVSDYEQEHLNDEVTALLAQGWVLQGGVSMRFDTDVIWYSQAMTKTTWVKQ